MGKQQFCDLGISEFEPLRKKAAQCEVIEPGDVLTDISGKKWKLGNIVGKGAFGEIFMASDCISKPVVGDSPYVAKIELHTNGPLFVETHFYLRVAKPDMINTWKQQTRKTIGLPQYIASGSHKKSSTRYRFLILPRYSIDLQQILDSHENKFNIKTVLTIAMQLLDTLEYIHSSGFIHADIKAGNILINEKVVPETLKPAEDAIPTLPPLEPRTRRVRSCRARKQQLHNLRSHKNHDVNQKNIETTKTSENRQSNQNIDPNQVYLLDYGLAGKYRQTNGDHKQYCVDARKAHAGTILFCSLDAHSGVQSRRSDLESLGYNMVYWITGVLPWMHNVDDYEVVNKKKQFCMQELENFLHFCFGKNIPVFLKNFFKHVKSLNFDEAPDYEYCRKVLVQGFNEYGYKKVFTLDFENKEGWGLKKKRIKNTENDRRRASVVCSIMRTPLKSNLPAKHVLRKKDKAKVMMRWSMILIDPELIIKSGKKMKDREHDENDNIDVLKNLNIHDLNPTENMLEVYNNYFQRQHNNEIGLYPKQKSNEFIIEGYNATMMNVYNKSQRNEMSEVAPAKKKRGAKKKKIVTDINVIIVSENVPVRRYNTRSSARVT